MFQEYENRKYEQDIFSSAVDLLVAWGKVNLFFSDNLEAKAAIEASWEKIEVEKSLPVGLTEMDRLSKKALDWLETQPCIFRDSANAHEVPLALEILDQVVMAADAADFFPSEKLVESDRVQLHGLLERATIDRAPSTLRLTPLNHWRRSRLSQIPENLHFLFPWYSEWVEVPSDILENVIENWPAFSTGSQRELAVDVDDAGLLNAFFVQLSQDEKLSSYMKAQIRTARKIHRAIEKSFGLRLFILSDKEAGKHAVPPKVLSKGLVACACKALQNWRKKFRSQVDQMEAQFFSAFCGPMMTEQDRLEIFEKIEKEMANHSNEIREGSGVLRRVDDWLSGRLDGRELAREAFRDWENLLVLAADQAEPVLETRETFLKELELVLGWEPDTPKVHRRGFFSDILDRISDFFVPSGELQGKMAGLAGAFSGGSEDENIFLSLPKNHFTNLEFHFVDGEMAIPGPEEDLSELTDFLLDVDYFWNAGYRLSGETETVPVSEEPLREEGDVPTLPVRDYAEVFLLISTREDLIQKVMSDESLSDEEKSQIIFLHYTAEEE